MTKCGYSNVLTFFFLTLWLACSACTTGAPKVGSMDFATVDLDASDQEDKVQPLISTDRFKELHASTEQESAREIIGLVFGPGLNRTIGHIPVIKYFNSRKIPYHVVMGIGMGAVFAAYVALGETHNKIEWDFYRLMSELKGVRPYSQEWMDIVDQKVLLKFKGKVMQELKKVLIIPLYDTKNDELTYFYKGDLYFALKYNLQLVAGSERQKYLSPLKGAPLELARLKKFNVDRWFGFDVLGDGLSFDKIGDDYLVGVFGKQISIRQNALKDYDGFYMLPLSEMPLDSDTSMPRFMKLADQKAKEVSEEVKEILKK